MIMKTEAPLVSVIVPIYNVAIYLHQCVNSILEQSYKNIEIILVNDGSTDDGRIICESFAKKDDRVRVIHQKNKGLVSARKLGLANTSGDYIFNLDGDDWLDPECIGTLVNHAVLDDVDIVISGYYREFVGLEVLISPRVPAKLYNREGIVNEIFPKMIFDCNVNTHGISTFSWGKLFKRKLILQHQLDVPEGITVGEDSVVTYPCIGNAKNLMVIDKPLYFYRQRTKSMLKSTSSSGNEVARVHRMCDFLQNKMKNIEYDFNSQIALYKLTLLAIRTGALFDGKEPPDWLFPLYLDFKVQKIALYSSGAFGQQMWQRFNEQELTFCGWFDEDHFESKLWGVDVSPISELPNIAPDVVIVASFDKQMFNVIKNRILTVFNKCEVIQPMIPEDSASILANI